jgi:hypothetical protein
VAAADVAIAALVAVPVMVIAVLFKLALSLN